MGGDVGGGGGPGAGPSATPLPDLAEPSPGAPRLASAQEAATLAAGAGVPAGAARSYAALMRAGFIISSHLPPGTYRQSAWPEGVTV